MEILGISAVVIALGVAGYVWKFRKTVTDTIPGKTDDKVLDTIEGVAETLEVDVDELAKKSRGRLKKELGKKL